MTNKNILSEYVDEIACTIKKELYSRMFQISVRFLAINVPIKFSESEHLHCVNNSRCLKVERK